LRKYLSSNSLAHPLTLSNSRLAHLDLEGLVMDAQVRELRDQFVTRAWSRQLYNGLYFSPEREFADNSIVFSQQNVTGEVRMMAYKGSVSLPLTLLAIETDNG
jgi:argininosuccinate synthase